MHIFIFNKIRAHEIKMFWWRLTHIKVILMSDDHVKLVLVSNRP